MVGWVNQGQLDIGIYKPIPGAKKLEIGLSKEEVRDLLGSPYKIDSKNPNEWSYILSWITFDESGKVIGWVNQGQLDIGIYKPIPGAKKLEIGLSRDDVRDLVGSPTKIDSRNLNEWYYSLSKITFDVSGEVTGWVNNGQLNMYIGD